MFLPYNADRPFCRSFRGASSTKYTYVRDTKDSINKIESMHLDPDTWLNMYDVTSMYTKKSHRTCPICGNKNTHKTETK